jgi:hypothetical protein
MPASVGQSISVPISLAREAEVFIAPTQKQEFKFSIEPYAFDRSGSHGVTVAAPASGPKPVPIPNPVPSYSLDLGTVPNKTSRAFFPAIEQPPPPTNAEIDRLTNLVRTQHPSLDQMDALYAPK